MPEGRFPGIGIHIGEPRSLVEKKLTAERYQIRSQIPGSVREDGTLWSGEEYCLEDQYETLYPERGYGLQESAWWQLPRRENSGRE